MKISVQDAQALATALTNGVDKAMAEGAHEFDLVEAMQSVDDAARDQLQEAIDAARKPAEG
jgi:deoxyribose-phosphate aldolase